MPDDGADIERQLFKRFDQMYQERERKCSWCGQMCARGSKCANCGAPAHPVLKQQGCFGGKR